MGVKIRISHLTVHRYSLTVMTSLYAVDKDLWDRNFLHTVVIDSAMYLINSLDTDKVAMSLYNIGMTSINYWYWSIIGILHYIPKWKGQASPVQDVVSCTSPQPSVLQLLHNHRGKGLVRLDRWTKCLWLMRPFDGAAAKCLLRFDGRWRLGQFRTWCTQLSLVCAISLIPLPTTHRHLASFAYCVGLVGRNNRSWYKSSTSSEAMCS